MRSIPLPRGLSLVLLLPTLVAQAPLPQPTGLRTSCGVRQVDGSVWAGGPQWKAEFRADGVEFTPALGERAPRNLPLALSLAAVGRADGMPADAHRPACAPEVEARQVRYRRGDCIERYDVSAAGLAMSFVFDRLPAGGGDLIVRLHARTELPLAVGAAADGVCFAQPGLGGVQIGAVTGVDATGRRCPGSIDCEQGVLELRLPAAFVAGATLPLVVDPLIGAAVPVYANTSDYEHPDCAALGGVPLFGGEFLCVFERNFSATDRDIRGQLLRADGSLDGGLLLLTNTTTIDQYPTVAALTTQQVYVVVFLRNGDLYGMSVDIAGTLGAETAISTGTDTLWLPDLGGERTAADNDVLCTFLNLTQDTVQALQIQRNASGTLTPFGTVTLASGGAAGGVFAPKISAHGGAVGRYLIVHAAAPSGSNGHPYGIVVDRNLNVLASAQLVGGTTDDRPTGVDGDGTDWVVAIEHKLNGGSVDSDVDAVPAHHDAALGSLVVGAPVTVAATPLLDEGNAQVAYLGASCLVTWVRRAAVGSTDIDLFAKTVDLFACTTCEPTVTIAASTAAEESATVAANLRDGHEGPALLLWSRTDTTTADSDIYAQPFASGDGVVEDVGSLLAGGCGQGGRTEFSCARVGNSAFRMRLRSARPAAPAWLVLSPFPTTLLCGGCKLAADPFAGVVADGVVTDSHGHGDVPLPIPASTALNGLQLHAQWIVTNPAGQCALIGCDFASLTGFRID